MTVDSICTFLLIWFILKAKQKKIFQFIFVGFNSWNLIQPSNWWRMLCMFFFDSHSTFYYLKKKKKLQNNFMSLISKRNPSRFCVYQKVSNRHTTKKNALKKKQKLKYQMAVLIICVLYTKTWCKKKQQNNIKVTIIKNYFTKT